MFKVVVNAEKQFSLWPADKHNPPGWSDAGFSGTKDEALSYINKNWRDMRPSSLQLAMQNASI